jgi:hypothetical protein
MRHVGLLGPSFVEEPFELGSFISFEVVRLVFVLCEVGLEKEGLLRNEREISDAVELLVHDLS